MEKYININDIDLKKVKMIADTDGTLYARVEDIHKIIDNSRKIEIGIDFGKE